MQCDTFTSNEISLGWRGNHIYAGLHLFSPLSSLKEIFAKKEIVAVAKNWVWSCTWCWRCPCICDSFWFIGDWILSIRDLGFVQAERVNCSTSRCRIWMCQKFRKLTRARYYSNRLSLDSIRIPLLLNRSSNRNMNTLNPSYFKSEIKLKKDQLQYVSNINFIAFHIFIFGIIWGFLLWPKGTETGSTSNLKLSIPIRITTCITTNSYTILTYYNVTNFMRLLTYVGVTSHYPHGRHTGHLKIHKPSWLGIL
jgi:hypothetical protein